MSQMANILIKDDSNTSLTMVPVKASNNEVAWRGNAAGVPADGQIRLSIVWEHLKNRTWRGSVKLEVPSMESVQGSTAAGYVAAPSVAYVTVVILTLFAPARSTNTDRANAVRMMIHALTGASSTAATEVDAAAGAANAFRDVADTRQVTYALVNEIPPA